MDFIHYRYDDASNISRVTNQIFQLANHIDVHPMWPRVHPFNLVNGPAVRDMIINKILNENFVVNRAQICAGKKIVFVGDILSDRGSSDFVTLCVFDWLTELNIDYRTICGNHDLDIWVLERFSQFAGLGENPEQHRSFDYFRTHIPEWQITFKNMYKRYLDRMALYYVAFEKHSAEDKYFPVLLTHAPASKLSFNSLIQHFKACVPSVIQFDYINHYDQVNNFFRKLLIDNEQLRKKGNGNKWTLDEKEFLIRTYIDFCFNRKFSDPFFEISPSPFKEYRISMNDPKPILPSLPISFSSTRQQAKLIKQSPIVVQTYPKFSSIVRSTLCEGYNIFGHMACERQDEDNVDIQPTQICLDSMTGMDPTICEGNVFYAFLQGTPCW